MELTNCSINLQVGGTELGRLEPTQLWGGFWDISRAGGEMRVESGKGKAVGNFITVMGNSGGPS